MPADGEPEKLIYTLEHAYTPAELGFGSLKGADAGIAEVVIAATQQSGCDVHLALISIEESGSAEYTGDDYPSRRGRYRDEEDGDEFRVVEVTDRRAVASAWRRSNGEPSPLTDIPILASESPLRYRLRNSNRMRSISMKRPATRGHPLSAPIAEPH